MSKKKKNKQVKPFVKQKKRPKLPKPLAAVKAHPPTKDVFYSLTTSGVTVNFLEDGRYRTVNVAANTEAYVDAVKAIRKNDMNKLVEAVNLAKKVSNFVFAGGDGVEVNPDGQPTVDGEALPSELAGRVLRHAKEGVSLESLVKFWRNLKMNPSYRAKHSLFRYLHKHAFPLTPDGHFIAWKGITADWKDCRTKKIDNSVGARVKMPRNEVDEDPNNTCSHGLHVAAFDFAHTQYGGGGSGRTIVVKVHPRDVVSVPTDYNDQKMRVCEYLVIGESTESNNNLNYDKYHHDNDDSENEY